MAFVKKSLEKFSEHEKNQVQALALETLKTLERRKASIHPKIKTIDEPDRMYIVTIRQVSSALSHALSAMVAEDKIAYVALCDDGNHIANALVVARGVSDWGADQVADLYNEKESFAHESHLIPNHIYALQVEGDECYLMEAWSWAD